MDSKEPLLESWPDGKVKPFLEDGDDGQQRTRVKSRNPFNFVGFVILGLIALGALRMNHIKMDHIWPARKQHICKLHKEEMITDFKQITPSEKLEWHRCFGNFQCARLTVPMDYNRPLNASKDNPKVDVALFLVPGRNYTSTGKYSRSPLLINPGGPGGSGVFFALAMGPALQQVVGFDQDIIGFDPRGIGSTTPVSDCWSFPSDRKSKDPSNYEIAQGIFHRYMWTASGQENGLVNSSADTLAKIDARDRATAKLCKTKDALYGEDSILRHVSTPSVARDMLSIIDAWDAWMDEKVEPEKGKTDEEIYHPEASQEDKSLDTRGKLVYWGFSYGSLLGATFASMFPDRVGRVILDGVVDADYYVSPVWAESILDVDKITDSFFHFCHEAGEQCALFRNGDSKSDIQARFKEASDRLKRNPIKGVNPGTLTPSVITYDILKYYTFIFYYSPTFTFPILAEIVDHLYRGDDEWLLSVFFNPYTISTEPFCNKAIDPGYQTQDAQLAIMCSDKRYPLKESVENLQSRFEEMSKISSFADVWMTLMIGCDGWAINATDPPMRWDDHPAHKPKPIKTSFPLLFLSNSADPVTPLYAGVKMARKFVGAGLVEQEGEGHCSLSAGSLCNLEKVRAYLNEGRVPAPPEWGPKGREIEEGKWERCERGDWPWKRAVMRKWSDGKVPGGENIEAVRTLRALEEIRRRGAMRWRFWERRNVGLEIDWQFLANQGLLA